MRRLELLREPIALSSGSAKSSWQFALSSKADELTNNLGVLRMGHAHFVAKLTILWRANIQVCYYSFARTGPALIPRQSS